MLKAKKKLRNKYEMHVLKIRNCRYVFCLMKIKKNEKLRGLAITVCMQSIIAYQRRCYQSLASSL